MAIEVQQPQTSAPPLKMTFQEYLKAYESVEGVQAEWNAGEVELYPLGNNSRHQDLVLFFANLFLSFLKQHRPGIVKLAGFRMYLGEDKSAREPDVLVIFSEHFDRIKETYLDGTADIVVEVVSPESELRDYGTKLFEYEAGGVPEYWLIDPIRRIADVYSLNDDGHYQRVSLDDRGRLLSALLPGFSVDPELLWRETIDADAYTIAALVEQMG